MKPELEDYKDNREKNKNKLRCQKSIEVPLIAKTMKMYLRILAKEWQQIEAISEEILEYYIERCHLSVALETQEGVESLSEMNYCVS